MAGRAHVPFCAMDGRRGYTDTPKGQSISGPAPCPPHPAVIEEELELQQIEIRNLVADSRALAEDCGCLQHELAAAKEEISRMTMVIADIHADKEAYCRELIEEGLKLECDLRAAEPLINDAIQLRAEVQKLNTSRQELAAQVPTITQDLTRAQADNQHIPNLKADIDGLQQELTLARTAVESEKKANVELMEQRQSMEKNLVFMACEIEKLRADLVSTEGRSQGAGGMYGVKFSSPEGPFHLSFGDNNILHLGVRDKASLYGVGSGPWEASGKSHIAHR